MTVAERICIKYPALIPELRIAIESNEDSASEGFKNRAKHTLKRLNKMNATL
jgi:hypothetical protein